MQKGGTVMARRRAGRQALFVLLAAASAVSPIAAQSWAPLDCPAGEAPLTTSCSHTAASDEIISIFFQAEQEAGPAAFTCADSSDPSAVYCARSLTEAEGGSSGTCYFLLPAGRGYRCGPAAGSGQEGEDAGGGGGVGSFNVISAGVGPMLPGTLDAAAGVLRLSCPSGVLGQSCTQPAQAQDVWANVAWTLLAPPTTTTPTTTTATTENLPSSHSSASSASSAPVSAAAASFICSAGGSVVCSYGASAAPGTADISSSCNFFLPANTALECTAGPGAAGAVNFTSSSAFAFAAPYSASDDAAKPVAPCPPSTSPPTPNDCDCSLPNSNKTADWVVSIAAGSVDAGYNSFHCGVGSINVCGWGSNTGMNGSAGSCVFIVPAGETYDCLMEWGAAAFSASSVRLAARSVVVAPSPASPASGEAEGHHHRVASARRRRPSPVRVPASSDLPRLRRLWAEWREEHADYLGDRYAGADRSAEADGFVRFSNHVAAATDAVRHIRDHPHLDELGRPTRFNRFADMSREEWVAAYRGRVVLGGSAAHPTLAAAASPPRHSSMSSPSPHSFSIPPPPAPPALVDWRDKGVVTGVKDQGQCGSCWSFSTTGAVESAWGVAGNLPLVPLSEQALVSCDVYGGNQGCGGGYPSSAMTYLSANGSFTEASYPYASGGGTAPACNSTGAGLVRAAANVTGWRAVRPDFASARARAAGFGGGTEDGTEDGMEDALLSWVAAYGPASILVDAMTQLWWTYVGGIMVGCCDTDIDHAVLLVGFNVSSRGVNPGGRPGGHGAAAAAAVAAAATSTLPYYIIKNSWGPSWGELGYVRLQWGQGECGIDELGDSVVPTVEGGPLPPPSLFECPFDSVPFNATTSSSNETTTGCLWVNGTHGLLMPPPSASSPSGLEQYCEYFSSGYMGYSFSGALNATAYPCAPSFAAGGDGGAESFCTLTAGGNGFPGFPPGSQAYCDRLDEGVIGYTWEAP